MLHMYHPFQALLRTDFSELTLLTIAHRLQTIIDYEQARRTRKLIKRTNPDHRSQSP